MIKQHGFSLIELMIVVAIIGILAAIAIPQYQNYIARSQLSEAPLLLDGLKSPIYQFWNINGRLPDDIINDLPGTVTAGKYVESITLNSSGLTLATATFKPSGINPNIFNKTIVMTFNSATNAFNFRCKRIALKMQPTSCKDT